jgi:hypothetical protein
MEWGFLLVRQNNVACRAPVIPWIRGKRDLAMLPGIKFGRLYCQRISMPKILPILVENRDMPDWEVDLGPEKGSRARVEL